MFAQAAIVFGFFRQSDVLEYKHTCAMPVLYTERVVTQSKMTSSHQVVSHDTEAGEPNGTTLPLVEVSAKGYYLHTSVMPATGHLHHTPVYHENHYVFLIIDRLGQI